KEKRSKSSDRSDSGKRKGLKFLAKMLLIVVTPAVIITIVSMFISMYKLNGFSEVLLKDQFISLSESIKQIYSNSSYGDYTVQNGMFMKGGMKLSDNFEVVDKIKETTGNDVTIFFGDTRMVTSISDESGNRIVNTKASDKVVKEVLENGKSYFAMSVDVNGKDYSGCYTPLIQDSNNEVVGMIFVGKERQQITTLIWDTITSILVGQIIVLAIGVILAGLLIRIVVRNIKNAISHLDEVALGRLSVQVPDKISNRADEIGDMARSIGKLVESFKTIINNIVSTSDSVVQFSERFKKSFESISTSIANINVAIDEIANGATSQANDTQKANNEVISMGSAIDETTNNIEKLASSSQKMKDYNETANLTLEELEQISERTKQSVDEVQNQTNITNQSVQDIRTATEVISGIARQTNLLSLNASIEAARAGENGRGFAIVADEIRELAEQSRASAESIANIVNTLIMNSDTSVRTMNEVTDIILVQNTKLADTKGIFDNLHKEITIVTEAVDSIANEVNQLSNLKDNVLGIVEGLASIAQENAASTEETSASMLELNQIVEECKVATVDLVGLSDELAKCTDSFKM
ncbi:MAG TPA: methyl-accepting chemotaxis protein, partial [Lachnospiraceae bacterium]|nr:methyl-accepting chemotaxis protein [Lachnospiraceae bacterium]